MVLLKKETLAFVNGKNVVFFFFIFYDLYNL